MISSAWKCVSLGITWLLISLCAAAIEQPDGVTSTEILQKGLGNNLAVHQDGSELSAKIKIQGHDNSRPNAVNSIEQIGIGSEAVIYIHGDRNGFDIRQEGTGQEAANNEVLVDVIGQSNMLEISQINGFGETFFNSSSISQLGDGNFAGIVQEVNPSTLIGGGNAASISQDGYDHIARIRQTGADNSALIDQSGAGNFGTILQHGEGLAAALYQDGVGLEYTINQSGCVIGTGCGTVTVSQTGP